MRSTSARGPAASSFWFPAPRRCTPFRCAPARASKSSARASPSIQIAVPSHRPYRPAVGPEPAPAEIEDGRGSAQVVHSPLL